MSRNQELIDRFLVDCAGNRECAVGNACKTLLLEMGVRTNEARIVVVKGRHSGKEFGIQHINWPEAEVYVSEKGVNRYFSAWEGEFLVANPQMSGPVDPQSKLNTIKTQETPISEQIPEKIVLASDIFRF